MTHVPRDAGFIDLVMCKGRLGRRGSLRERLALWLARYVATAIMRDAEVRKEFAISLGIEFDLAERNARRAAKISTTHTPPPPPPPPNRT